jgi:tRNA A-37 threonylcarbamoyl transferase component Bud32
MEQIEKLATKIYITTPHSFIKKEYAPHERRKNLSGKPIIWKWGAERLRNEAAGIALVAERTTIPVPRVLYCGTDENDVMYLEVERVEGIVCEDVGEKCRMPLDRAHTVHGRCSECEKMAFENVNNFIETEVIPQLKNLTSNQTGLHGFVLPPPRIEQFDNRATWSPKQSSRGQEYVFCHGDLSRSNIILDPDTLGVKCIIDWECAGFFPAEFELKLWRLNFDEYMKTFQYTGSIRREIELITGQYEITTSDYGSTAFDIPERQDVTNLKKRCASQYAALQFQSPDGPRWQCNTFGKKRLAAVCKHNYGVHDTNFFLLLSSLLKVDHQANARLTRQLQGIVRPLKADAYCFCLRSPSCRASTRRDWA